MIILSLSDLHLAEGRFLESGQANILEDFVEDERFYEFCEHFSSGDYLSKKVHLVLNGDIFNLVQIRTDATFTHIIDADYTLESLKKIKKGHPLFFEGLRKFLSAPHKKLTYVIGNHDASMAFREAQRWLCNELGEQVHFCFEINVMGVHLEHGHRFEAINYVPESKYFIRDQRGRSILNLPWGSLFCIFVLPQLKKSRPLIDRVRPISSYIKWLIVHDFKFFLRMVSIVLKYLWQSRSEDFVKQNRNFRTTLRVLKQSTVQLKYEKLAKKILKKNKSVHTVVMGHTHIKEWRRFPEGRYYFNTGTWTPNPSLDAGLYEEGTKLCYCFIEVHEASQTLRKASLSLWQGRWRPYRNEILI